jgi:hypothetical protein
VNVPDAETNEYLDAVAENHAPFTRCRRDLDVPTGVGDDPLADWIVPCRPNGGQNFHPLNRPIALQTPPARSRTIVSRQKTGAERKHRPNRGRRPGVVSPGVDRLSKRDATRRFAVGAVCFSRRGRHLRWQNDWSQAVADLSSANGGAAPARFEGRNIVGAQADRRPQARVPNPWLPAGRVPSTLGER